MLVYIIFYNYSMEFKANLQDLKSLDIGNYLAPGFLLDTYDSRA